MKKWNKIITIHSGILASIFLIIILFTLKFEYIYGSNVDFIRQHAVFPDYFRNLFYETGDLFPNFALHLGGGQNIFYYAYYGFLSPIVLLSYFFPFIEMTIYLTISSIILIFISVILLYYFLRKNDFNYSTCFIGSLLFLLSNSLVFHSHRHLMFVNYMPFLILALIGVIRYFKKNKSFLLIISIFLMILTSYYFSIPGILAICLYGLYYYLKLNPSAKLKEIVKAAGIFLIRIFLGILLASFFLLPIAYIILNGRDSSSITFGLEILKPSVNLKYLMYGTYGVGATSILWIATIYNLIFGKKENRIISIFLSVITLIPLINLLLNGGLYANGKCFIPLLPLYILLITNMIKEIEKKNIKWPLLLFGLFFSFIFLNINKSDLSLFLLEIIITLLCIFIFYKKQNYFFLAPIIIIAFFICLKTNTSDKLITIEEYQAIQEINNYDYEKYLNMNNSIYRFISNKNDSNTINYSKAANDYRITSYSSTTNPYYTEVFYNIFNNNDIYRNKFMLNETNNLFFQRFMGIKYLLTDINVPYGYSEIKKYKNATLYETNNVLPIGFATDNLLNHNEYKKLPFNEQLETFGNNIIINNESNNANLTTISKKVNLEYKITNIKNVNYEKNNNHYLINSKKNGSITLTLNESISSNSLIIRFKMNSIPSCKNGDVSITINDISNKLTCGSWKYYNENETFDYVLSSNKEINNLEIKFSEGNYDISDIEIYQIPNSYFNVDYSKISILKINDTLNKNILSGTIDVKKDGYFMFTIPYDQGFELYIDDEKKDYELVNEGFIGFNIKKGNHKIELKFTPPLLTQGSIISGIAFISISILVIIEKKKTCKK